MPLPVSPPSTNPATSIPEPTFQPTVIQIDAQADGQTIEGFGASGAWWAQDVGGWEEDKRNLIADLLFDREKGIGLSVYRYNIGGGDGESIQDIWRRAETFEIAPHQYDWTRDGNALWMLRAAHDRGVQHYVAFVNSPPARMTVSGTTTGANDGESNLKPAMYAEFSQYLVDVVRHLRDVEGIPIDWISPVNEPQWDWSTKNGQEGCHYEPEEVLDLARVLLQTLHNDHLDGVKLSLFESGNWGSSEPYIEKLASDPDVWNALPNLSLHSYGSSSADKVLFMRYFQKYPDKNLWMSEWTEMQDGRDTGMSSALVLATTIHDDLTITGVSSWQYWIAVSKYQYHDGLIYVDTSGHTIQQTKRLWTMGNYSRFILPGYVRLGAHVDSETLLVSAFRSADRQNWVVVAVNQAYRPVRIQLGSVHGQLPKLLKQYETSEQSDLAEIRSGSSQDILDLAPRSITTLALSP